MLYSTSFKTWQDIYKPENLIRLENILKSYFERIAACFLSKTPFPPIYLIQFQDLFSFSQKGKKGLFLSNFELTIIV